MELLDLGTFVRLAAITIGSFLGTMALWGIGRRIYRSLFAKKNYWGDKITGRTWVASVKPGARNLHHAFSCGRCNYCGQKNLEELLDFSDIHRQHWLCVACGAKFNVSTQLILVLRRCTDPIPELGRPATHGEVSQGQLEVRINVCKTCDGSKFVMVPQGNWSDAEYYYEDKVKTRCPDCYVSNDDSAPKSTMSARKRLIEHTRAKVSAEEADRLKEPMR